jgi:AraC family transcriptional activator FtrA
MPDSVTLQSPIKVAILAYPNLCLFEFASALEVFAQRRPEFDFQHYEVKVCALQPSGKTSFPIGDVSVSYSHGIDSLRDAQLIIIPGWQGVDVKPESVLVDELQAAHHRGVLIASICSGAFLLGYAGLLDGKRATTHWRYVDKAASLFPSAKFNPDVLYTDDQHIVTSAGSAAGIDMCLYIVAKHFGQRVANAYAKRLVVTPFREGGQAQFVQSSVEPVTRADKLSALIEHIQSNLAASLSVTQMADQVNLSERQFLRQFKARYQTTPSRYIIRLRVHKACELLESTQLPIKSIATQCGLGSEESLRHHFRVQLKTSPLAYRERFTQPTKV